MKNRPGKTAAFVGTAFGLGYAPFAPGTAGILLAVAIHLAIFFLTPPALHFWLIGAALIGACVVTVLITPACERYFGKKDPGAFVMDEVAGYLLTVLFFRTPNIWPTVAWAFVVTRFFDIVKPPPIRRLEKLPSGWGILIDDLAASVYAIIVLYLIAWASPSIVGGSVRIFG